MPTYQADFPKYRTERLLEDPRLLLPPAGEGRSSVSCDQVRAVIGSSWFLLLRPGYPQPYGFHIAESSASICSRCRNQYTPIKDPLVAPGLRAAGSEPRSLVEVAGFEPASSTHPFQHLDSVSAVLRPSHCGPTKARLCSYSVFQPSSEATLLSHISDML